MHSRPSLPCSFSYFIFLSLFLPFSTFSQSTSQDSLNTSVKISDSIYQKNPDLSEPFIIPYRSLLFNASWPLYDVFISRWYALYQPVFYQAGDYRSGIRAYSNYLAVNSTLPLPDSAKSLSQLDILLGSKREQVFFLTHHQRAGKNSDFTLSYNSIVSEGFLKHQFGKMKGFSLRYNLELKRYRISPFYTFRKVDSEENGGMVPGADTKGFSKSDFQTLAVNLNQGERKLKNHRAGIIHAFDILKNNSEDSLTTSSLSLDLEHVYELRGWSYNGPADTSFYNNIYLDSVLTSDSSGYKLFKNTAALSYKSTGKIQYLISAGASFDITEQKTDSIKDNLSFTTPFLKLYLEQKNFNAGAIYRRVLSDDYLKDDQSLILNLRYMINNKFFNSLEFTFKRSELSPAYQDQYYLSNHFTWTNNFIKEDFQEISGIANLFNNHLSITGGIKNYDHPVYYNHDAAPFQYESKVNVAFAGVQADIIAGKWRIFSHLLWQNSDKHVIPLPEFLNYSRVSYTGEFFKKALKAEFGFESVFISSYRIPGFMPATAQYYLQSEETETGPPVVHVFTNLSIGTAVIFLRLEHIGHGLTGNEYFAGPGYPVPPRTLKFGLRWTLIN